MTDRTVVVMGVANKWSIAWAIAKQLKEAGASLIFTYYGEKSLKGLQKLLDEEGLEESLTISCDVTSDEDIALHFKRIESLREEIGKVLLGQSPDPRHAAVLASVGRHAPHDGSDEREIVEVRQCEASIDEARAAVAPHRTGAVATGTALLVDHRAGSHVTRHRRNAHRIVTAPSDGHQNHDGRNHSAEPLHRLTSGLILKPRRASRNPISATIPAAIASICIQSPAMAYNVRGESWNRTTPL